MHILLKAYSAIVDVELSKQHALAERRQRLENALYQIDEMFAAVRNNTACQARNILGVDEAWRTRLLQKRLELSRQLALAKADESEQAHLTSSVLRRQKALEKLERDEETAKKASAIKTDQEKLQGLIMLATARNPGGRFP